MDIISSMDAELRNLERRALQGDAEAALAFVVANRRYREDALPTRLFTNLFRPGDGFNINVAVGKLQYWLSISNLGKEEVGLEITTTNKGIGLVETPTEWVDDNIDSANIDTPFTIVDDTSSITYNI